jgi:hypothetical protein
VPSAKASVGLYVAIFYSISFHKRISTAIPHPKKARSKRKEKREKRKEKREKRKEKRTKRQKTIAKSLSVRAQSGTFIFTIG